MTVHVYAESPGRLGLLPADDDELWQLAVHFGSCVFALLLITPYFWQPPSVERSIVINRSFLDNDVKLC